MFPIIRQDHILSALTSLRKHTPEGYKTIVVNQTAQDERFEKELWEACDLVIRPSLNYGMAQASNLGTRLAATEYVTICNDDVIFFWDGWWDGILAAFDDFPTAIAINPMSPKEPGWGYGESGYRVHATLEECQADPDSVVKRLKEKWGNSNVDGFAAWCAVFRRKEWMELGMFDERFFPGGGEDYDAMSRIYQAHGRAISTPKSWVWHHWGQSKDEPTGFNTALPNARDYWNKLSTKGFGDQGLWDPDCDIWGREGERIDKNVWRAPL